MTSVYKILFCATLLLSVSNHALAKLAINLPYVSSTMRYQTPVRLSQFLFDAQKLLTQKTQPPTFWLAAQLLQTDKNEQIDLLKKRVLSQLDILSRHPDSNVKAQLLATFIKNNHFNYRHFINLDNDLVRISAQDDPLLAGNFKLLTPPRINKIQIIGTSQTGQLVNVIEHAAINDYLNKIALPVNSATSLVYIIQPDGKLSKVHNAAWKHTPIFFAPGARLFIGFSKLPDQLPSLNEKIAELLRYLPPVAAGENR